jgi:hypothetical protein
MAACSLLSSHVHGFLAILVKSEALDSWERLRRHRKLLQSGRLNDDPLGFCDHAHSDQPNANPRESYMSELPTLEL